MGAAALDLISVSLNFLSKTSGGAILTDGLAEVVDELDIIAPWHQESLD